MISRFINERINAGKQIKKIPYDPFIKRLRSLVIGEGMLHEGNIYLMDLAIKNMPHSGNILEIGSYGGLSTNLILYLLSKNMRIEYLMNCDPWIYEGFDDAAGEKNNSIDGRPDISRIDYADYMRHAFIRSVKFLNAENLPFTFHLTSDDFFKLYNQKKEIKDIFGRVLTFGSKVSFAYIDGNHHIDFVQRDFENVDKFLLKNGFILFDDSADDQSFGSTSFMKQMKKNNNYQLVEKNPNYLFQKIV